MLYLAYGMNTNSNYMSTTSRRLGPATLLDYKWEMLQFANVHHMIGVTSVGILWDIDEAELERLDYREGYPTFYNRTLAEVIHNDEVKQAIVYYMTDEYRTKLARQAPSMSYVNDVQEGFAEDGIKCPVAN